MKIFNAFQIVCLFAATPLGIEWLSNQSFAGSDAAFWTAIVAYIVAFIGMTASVRVAIDKLE